jgi:hypothetical protein
VSGLTWHAAELAHAAEKLGELGYLPAISPSVHRLATAVADAIADTSSVFSEVAQIQRIALAGVVQIILTETGRGTRDGESQTEIADRLCPRITNILDELDRWSDSTPQIKWLNADGSTPIE